MTRTLRYSIADLTDYINWLYLLHAWALPPRLATVAGVHPCPSCRAAWLNAFSESDRPKSLEAARLYDDAMALLRQVPADIGISARIGIFPARSEGDDIWVTTDGGSELRLPFLRQQKVSRTGDPNLCLADFVSPHPEPAAPTDDVAHRIGIFATATDEALERLFPDDDYRHMLCQTLADRLAEAAAERLHEEVRRTLWGYAPDEAFTPSQLFAEPYQGRRPAIGYPSIPDQSLIFLIDRAIGLSEIRIRLTESGMMMPHAAVAGLMIGHPATRHFAVGPIDEHQLRDYAARRGLPADTLRRFLAANLEYGDTTRR